MGSIWVLNVRGSRGSAVLASFLPVAVVTLASGLFTGAAEAQAPGVAVSLEEAARRIDVRIDGQPFTSWVWPESLTKPVLHPIRTERGTVVTRGFPLEPVAGERPDHPHQVGLWVSYGAVNGVDFWNNSSERPPAEQATMGRAVQRRILAAESGPTTGVVSVAIDWRMPDGSVVLEEETTLLMGKVPGGRYIERSVVLAARDRPVTFGDNKEGFLGLRVARWLEHPSNTPVVLTDASGQATGVPTIDNTGVSGMYHTSEEVEGDAVWGTRARWAALSGQTAGENVTIAILDDPKNPGAPTYWHARGYGLFAANPLGPRSFSPQNKPLGLTLSAGQRAHFRWRVLILSMPFDTKRISADWKKFAERR
jgi:hypothetical protein